MDINPYTPGAGSRPAYLAGRDEIIEGMIQHIISVRESKFARHTVFYGVRGVGKTVLHILVLPSLFCASSTLKVDLIKGFGKMLLNLVLGCH